MNEHSQWHRKVPWFLMCLVLATALFSAWIALQLMDEGAGSVRALLLGAGIGTGIVLLIGRACVETVRVIWELTRGYPFIAGDSVEVIRGPLRGARGEIVSCDQADWNFEVAFGDPEGDYTSEWLSAWKLRKVSRSRGQTRSLGE